jgi:hypothetical protein
MHGLNVHRKKKYGMLKTLSTKMHKIAMRRAGPVGVLLMRPMRKKESCQLTLLRTKWSERDA